MHCLVLCNSHDDFKQICKRVTEKVFEDFKSKPRPGGIDEFFHESRSAKIADLIERSLQKRQSSSSASSSSHSNSHSQRPAGSDVANLLSTIDSFMRH
jgi:hypothetical protein